MMKQFRSPFLKTARRWASVVSEVSPNPEATVFWVEKGRDILGKGAKSLIYADRYSCGNSPLAGALFKVCFFIECIFICIIGKRS